MKKSKGVARLAVIGGFAAIIIFIWWGLAEYGSLANFIAAKAIPVGVGVFVMGWAVVHIGARAWRWVMDGFRIDRSRQ